MRIGLSEVSLELTSSGDGGEPASELVIFDTDLGILGVNVVSMSHRNTKSVIY